MNQSALPNVSAPARPQPRKTHCPACHASLPEPEPVYRKPAEVFSFWYNKLRARVPGERPTAEALHQASGLPLSTCLWYRRQYEAVFPDAYALSQVRRNLRLSRRQLKSMKRARPSPEERTENAFTNLANLPPPPPCTSPPSV